VKRILPSQLGLEGRIEYTVKQAFGINARGSILVVSLWAVIFFAMMVVTLGVRTQNQTKILQRIATEQIQSIQAHAGISGLS